MDNLSNSSLIQEDNQLKNQVERQEKPNWATISTNINEYFPQKNRTAKQCR